MMRGALVALLILFSSAPALAENSLLYLEAQGIAGYSWPGGVIYRSDIPDDVMQLNSVGFDYIRKFSGEYGDFATFALQARLAFVPDSGEDKARLQLYNAYFKAKGGFADVWAGHNRIAFGLASWWDTHGELLQPLYIYGFGFDRDWGVGLSRDTASGSFSAAVTLGSGMGIRDYGNAVFTARASQGVLG